MTDYKQVVESELHWLDKEIAIVRKQLNTDGNVELQVRENMLLNEKERLLERTNSVN